MKSVRSIVRCSHRLMDWRSRDMPGHMMDVLYG